MIKHLITKDVGHYVHDAFEKKKGSEKKFVNRLDIDSKFIGIKMFKLKVNRCDFC